MANGELYYRTYYTLLIYLTTPSGTQIIWHRMGGKNKFVRISTEIATVSGV
jgi:subtilisin-like proprotein convertase family protein